jgi:hypothetical protein
MMTRLKSGRITSLMGFTISEHPIVLRLSKLYQLVILISIIICRIIQAYHILEQASPSKHLVELPNQSFLLGIKRCPGLLPRQTLGQE